MDALQPCDIQPNRAASLSSPLVSFRDQPYPVIPIDRFTCSARTFLRCPLALLLAPILWLSLGAFRDCASAPAPLKRFKVRLPSAAMA